MAIEKQNQASVLKVKVGTGTSAMGATTYTVRTVADINPALTDADLFAIGKAFGDLQIYPVGSINRVDSAALLETAGA